MCDSVYVGRCRCIVVLWCLIPEKKQNLHMSIYRCAVLKSSFDSIIQSIILLESGVEVISIILEIKIQTAMIKVWNFGRYGLSALKELSPQCWISSFFYKHQYQQNLQQKIKFSWSGWIGYPHSGISLQSRSKILHKSTNYFS